MVSLLLPLLIGFKKYSLLLIMELNKLAFTTEKMSKLDSNGFELYQLAESNPSAQNYFKAGEVYDRSYESKWGDYIFAGRSWQEFIRNYAGFFPDYVTEDHVREMIKNSQESLVISCECYIKALQQDSNHYFANLHLATALTAALQVEASIPYWAKSLSLRSSDTVGALVADCLGPNNKGIATKLVCEYLGLGHLNATNLLSNADTKIYGEVALKVENTLNDLKYLLPENYRLINIQSYTEQKKFANSLLISSPLLISNIEYLYLDKCNQLEERPRTQTSSVTQQNQSSQASNFSLKETNTYQQQNTGSLKPLEIASQNTNHSLNQKLESVGATKSRPKEISIICILGFITVPYTILIAFSNVAMSIGSWYPPLLILLSIVSLVIFIGMWMMKKWSVYSYTSLVVMGQIILLTHGLWNPLGLVMPLLYIHIGFKNLSKMS